MLVACDVDDVLNLLHEEWFRRYNRDYDDALDNERCRSWDIHKCVKPECGEKIYDYLYESDFYEHVKVLPGAQDGVAALREMGHRVIFVTSPVKGTMDQKWEWLERYGFIDVHSRASPDLVMMHDKTLINAQLLIDDRGETVVDWVQNCRKRAILYEYPHNHSVIETQHSAFWAYCSRARHWDDIIRIVQEMAT